MTGSALADHWLSLIADDSLREQLRRAPGFAVDGSVTRGTFRMRLHRHLGKPA